MPLNFISNTFALRTTKRLCDAANLYAMLICLLLWSGSALQAQTPGVSTGVFRPAVAPIATLTLVNATDGAITDGDLIVTANALSQRVANVAVIARPTRIDSDRCYDGEWCLLINRETLKGTLDSITRGAAIGSAAAMEIMRKLIN